MASLLLDIVNRLLFYVGRILLKIFMAGMLGKPGTMAGKLESLEAGKLEGYNRF
jgi:hypothetical protein